MSSASRPERLPWWQAPARLAFPGSLRLRLTVWYTLFLAVVLLLSLHLLSTLLERQVRSDLDDRISVTAEEVGRLIESHTDVDGFTAADIPDLTVFAVRGQYIRVLDLSGVTVAESVGVAEAQLPSPEPFSSGPVFTTAMVSERELREVTVGVYLRHDDMVDRHGTVVVAEWVDPRGTLEHVRRLLVSIAVLGIAVAAIGGWLLARGALKPIDDVTLAASTLASKPVTPEVLADRLQVPNTRDETEALARAFNTMLERLQETFEFQRRFVADASHELRTPLTAIRSNAELLQAAIKSDNASLDRDDLEAGIAGIVRGSERLSRMIGDLLVLARTDAMAPEHDSFALFRLDEVASAALTMFTQPARAAECRLELHAPEPVTIWGSLDDTEAVIANLVENAIRHTSHGGAVDVHVLRTAEGWGRVEVRDTGPGIPLEEQQSIFERFYRSSRSRARWSTGTGLGLAIARSFVERQGGRIWVESAVGEGATFVVELQSGPVDVLSQRSGFTQRDLTPRQ